MTETGYHADSIRTAATNLGKILDDMAPFNDLKAHWPNAGKFELAQWLERVVDDRRNAVVAHAEHLRMMFDSMNSKLAQIADDFSSLDGDNAKEIKGLLGDLEGTVKGEWGEWDENTESDHNNFHSDSKGGKNNAQDGDGYNDNLTIPVGKEDPGAGDEDDDEDEDDDDDEDDDEDDEDEDDEDDEDDANEVLSFGGA